MSAQYIRLPTAPIFLINVIIIRGFTVLKPYFFFKVNGKIIKANARTAVRAFAFSSVFYSPFRNNSLKPITNKNTA